MVGANARNGDGGTDGCVLRRGDEADADGEISVAASGSPNGCRRGTAVLCVDTVGKRGLTEAIGHYRRQAAMKIISSVWPPKTVKRVE